MDFPEEMTVDSWFEYWISMKKRTVRPNTVRNYTERYHRNIKPIIGKKILGSVNTIQCQTVMNRMADEGYRTSTIYQARITLYNMLDYANQNDVIMKNPCNKMVRSDIGKPSEKKETLTLQTILGHSNIGITMNLYVHTTEEQKQKEIDQIADALKVV